jgi:hypothetical protein
MACQCVILFGNLLTDLKIDPIPNNFCDCIIDGQHRSNNKGADIITVRYGEAAIRHFTALSEQIVTDNDLNLRCQDLVRNFHDTRKNIPDDQLVVREFLTGRYMIDFCALDDLGRGEKPQ